MANRWGNNGNSERLYFLGGSKITADDAAMKLKDTWSLEKKLWPTRQRIKKQAKVHPVKAMVFPLVMYGCQSWTIKKAKHRRIDAFEVWYWRRLLRVPWTARSNQSPKGNQPWIFIGRTDAEAEAPIHWPPDVKNWLIGKDLDSGKDWRQKEKGMTGWDGWMASLTQWTWVRASSRSWWWTGKPGVWQSMGSQRVGHNWVTKLNWTELTN